MGSELSLHDQAPIKTLDTKAEVSFPAWQYFMCIATQSLGKVSASHDSIGKGQQEVSCFELSWTLSHISFLG